jgi:hypothetical protein
MHHGCRRIWQGFSLIGSRWELFVPTSGRTYETAWNVCLVGTPLRSWKKLALEPASDILVRDRNYPAFLEAAYKEFLISLNAPPEYNTYNDQKNAKLSLVILGKCYRATAAILHAPGPLNLENTYANWPRKLWHQMWEDLRQSPNLEMKDMLMDAMFEHIHSLSKGRDHDAVDQLLQTAKEMPAMDLLVQHILNECLRLGIMPELLRGQRAYATVSAAILDEVACFDSLSPNWD